MGLVVDPKGVFLSFVLSLVISDRLQTPVIMGIGTSRVVTAREHVVVSDSVTSRSKFHPGSSIWVPHEIKFSTH